MSASISLPHPRPMVKKNVAYSIPSSSSEKMRLIPIETQSRVNYPNEVPAGMSQAMQLPVDYYPNIVHQEMAYHPPQFRFPIRICGIHGCGIALTQQKDGNRPICHKHAIEIDMLRRGNPYPPCRPPQPRCGKEKEREIPGPTRISKPSPIVLGQFSQHVDIGPPRHKLHALTPVQRSLLAQTDNRNGFGTIDPRVLTNQPALPQPSKLPLVVDSYHQISECLDAAAVEAAVAHRRAIERAARPHATRERAAKFGSQNLQNSQPPPVREADYPFVGDASGRTIYAPHSAPSNSVRLPANVLDPSTLSAQVRAVHYDPYPPMMQSEDTAGVCGVLQPIIPPQVVMDPPINQLEGIVMPPSKQCRAVSLPLGPSGPTNGGYISEQNLLGKRKRGRGGSVAEAEDERRREHQASRSMSEPLLSLSSSNEMKIRGWEGDMNVDVKECKGTLPMEFDLVTAVGNAVQNALLSLNLEGLELVYPEPVNNIVPRGNPYPNIAGKQENLAPEVSDLTAHDQSIATLHTSTKGHPYPEITHKQEKLAPEVIDLTADDQFVATSHTSASQSAERSNNPYLAIHIPQLNSTAFQIPKISRNSREQSQSSLQSRQTPSQPLQCLTLPRTSSVPNIRTCSTAGCPGLVKPDSTMTRCYKCVMSDWKARKEAALKPNNHSTTSRFPSGLTLRLKPIKINGQSKRVAWADGYRSSDEDEMEEDEKRALEEDMIREEEDRIPGWDSDLTDLEDSSEESSEDFSTSESSDNSSDEAEDTEPPSLRSFKIRIPPRPRPLLDVNAPPFESKDTEEGPPHVSSIPDEVPVGQASSLATVAIVEDDAFPTPVAATEDDTTSSLDLTASSPSQILPEESPPLASTETQESDTKPTPRIRITLSQISKLSASSSSASLSPMSSLPLVDAASTPTNCSTSPSPAPELEVPRISDSVPNSSGRTCVIRKCGQVLPMDYTCKCCPSCRTHNREHQRKRPGCQERCAYNCVKPAPSGSSKNIESTSPSKPTGTFEPVPLRNFVTRGSNYKVIDIHDLLVPKARICTIRSCRHILPGPNDHKWKMCHPCREKTTRTRRIRQIKATSGGIVDPAVLEAEVPALQPLVQDPSRILHSRCANVDCGVKLEKGKEQTSDSCVECNQCLWRRKSPDERKSNPLELHDQVLVVLHVPRNKEPTREHSPSNIRKPATNPYPPHVFPPEKPRPAAPYPEYLTLSHLLSNFHRLFSHFLQAQSYYVSYNEASDNPRGKSIAKFSFDGEFSSVAPDLQVLKRETEVFETVENVKEEIERLGRIKFDPSARATSIAYGGFVARYTCQNQVPISLPGPAPQPNLHLKMMRGELEVVVLPVDTHRFLPGQRTVVRFRLVG